MVYVSTHDFKRPLLIWSAPVHRKLLYIHIYTMRTKQFVIIYILCVYGTLDLKSESKMITESFRPLSPLSKQTCPFFIFLTHDFSFRAQVFSEGVHTGI